jgi:hypothetical protein
MPPQRQADPNSSRNPRAAAPARQGQGRISRTLPLQHPILSLDLVRRDEMNGDENSQAVWPDGERRAAEQQSGAGLTNTMQPPELNSCLLFVSNSKNRNPAPQ